jgi:hypothetical protein
MQDEGVNEKIILMGDRSQQHSHDSQVLCSADGYVEWLR